MTSFFLATYCSSNHFLTTLRPTLTEIFRSWLQVGLYSDRLRVVPLELLSRLVAMVMAGVVKDFWRLFLYRRIRQMNVFTYKMVD